MGKLGNLNVVLQEGIINYTSRKLSSLSISIETPLLLYSVEVVSKAFDLYTEPAVTRPRVFAQLIYKHTTYTSGILGGKF